MVIVQSRPADPDDRQRDEPGCAVDPAGRPPGPRSRLREGLAVGGPHRRGPDRIRSAAGASPVARSRGRALHWLRARFSPTCGDLPLPAPAHTGRGTADSLRAWRAVTTEGPARRGGPGTTHAFFS